MERLTHRRKSDGAVCPNCTQTDIETRWGEVVQEMADKLCDYEDAEERGKLVRLPCKVGDEVYAADWKTVRKIEVESISITKIATFIRGKYLEAGIVSYISGTFGNSIFLTREEAEAALAKEV